MAEATKTNNGNQPCKALEASRSRKKLFRIRLAFIGLWIFFSGIIFVIAILTDINWTRPNLEEFIGHSLHRDVKLGHLKWHFGFKGLTVQTSSLSVAEPSGEPFLMSGNCEIGFSFLPFLLGKSTIHHFDLHNVLFMAVRTGEHHWNFDDLLVSCPDIDFVDCHDGHVFVIDRQPTHTATKFPDTELNNVEIQLHRAGSFKPSLTHISFTLPVETNEPARFEFTEHVWDKEKSCWWTKNSQFHLNCRHFSLQNWQALSAVISADKQTFSWLTTAFGSVINNPQAKNVYKLAASFTKGIFDINAEADGIPNHKFKIDLAAKAQNLVYLKAGGAPTFLPEITSSAKIYFEPDYFKIDKLVARVPDYNILVNYSQEQKKIKEEWQTHGDILGLFGDLENLSPFITLASLAFPDFAVINSENLPDGKLFVDLKFSKSDQKTKYNLETTIADCKLNRLLNWLQTANNHNKNISFNDTATKLLTKYLQPKSLEKLCLSRQAKFTGTVLFKSDDGLTLKDCSLADDAMVWKFSGKADRSAELTELQFSSKDLQLGLVSKTLNKNRELSNRINTWLGLNSASQISITGKAQVTAKLNQANIKDKVNRYLTCEAVLNDADFRLNMPAINLHHLTGTYMAKIHEKATSALEELSFKNIHGYTSSGTVNIDANLPTNPSEPINFHLRATDIILSELTAILQLFRMDTKFFSHWQLSGKLKEIDLVVTGTATKPLLHLTAIPDDIAFSFANSQALMHAKSGKITYTNEFFTIEKSNIIGPASNLLVGLAIKNPDTTATLEQLSTSITNADLSDLQSCFLSDPKSLYFKNLVSNLGQFKFDDLKGKVSGNLEYKRRGDQNLRGYLDLDNLSLRYGPHKLLCHNFKGKVTFTGNDLIYHGITGDINNSSITLEGRLVNYQTKQGQWRGESTLQILPSDLTDILSLMVADEEITTVKCKVKKSIIVKIKSTMAQNAFSHSFSALIDPDSSLYFSSHNFYFQQPTGKKLVITGSCRKDEQQLQWNYLSFDLAGSQIIAKGNVRNTTNSLNLTVTIPEFTEVSLLESAFCPDLISGTISGRVKGTINIQGNPNAPLIGGKIILSNVGLPALFLSGINGDLALQPTPPMGGQISLLTQMHLKDLNLGTAPLQKASGTLNYCASTYNLKDFIADIAGGKLTAAGKLDLTQKTSTLDLNIQEAELAELWPQINSSQIDFGGPLSCHFNFNSSGNKPSELEENMSGSGTIHVGSGYFNRSGLLHARLNQVNLLHQGLFGFNVNNLLQSVVPAKTSGFDSIDGAFGLSKEIFTIRRLLYDSKDLKFSAAGKANLALQSLELDVAGVMPRVSSSVIHGPIGEISREITLQKFLDSLTLHKLDKLPSLPLIGGIGSRTDLFTCRIVAPYNQPKMISQSIQKSFQWMNYRQANVPTKHVQ